MNYAKLEAQMAERERLKNERERMKDQIDFLDSSIEGLLTEGGLTYHHMDLDEDYILAAELKEKNTKVFEKEQMADDMKVEPSHVMKKDFLINMTEKRKLTLEKFKTYFSHHSELKLSVSKKKKKKKKKR